MPKYKECQEKVKERLNKVGGQAVLEGVMMKAGEKTVTSCRKEDGTIVVYDDEFHSVRKNHKLLNIPILRGVINFAEMLILSYKTLGNSADALGIDELSEEEKAKKEKKRAEKAAKKKGAAQTQDGSLTGISPVENDTKKGKKQSSTTDIIMAVSLILGVALAVGLFIVLPNLAAGGVEWLYMRFISDGEPMGAVAEAVIAGIMKMIIFIVYLSLVALMPDIKRTFMYHGAEHKSIACFEAGEELTPANAMKYKRFHPRCGTSFMFLMILIGIFVGMLARAIFPEKHQIFYSAFSLLVLPLTMGIGYEILMIAGKHDNVITRIVSAPGMWVQRITTKEPTEDMLEIAITSIKCALRDDFPEFKEFYRTKAWEKKEEPDKGAEACNEGTKNTEACAEECSENTGNCSKIYNADDENDT